MKYQVPICLLLICMTLARSGKASEYGIYGIYGINGINGINQVKGSTRREDDKSTITRLEHEWLDAMKTHNYSWFERNFSADCTEVNSGNGALKAKDQDIADFKADTTVFDILEFEDLKVRVEGNAAVANGITHILAHDEQGQKFDVRLSFTDTWIKRDGRWQVWAAQHTRIRP
jgi:ketosteroid isomerase-like protein